MRSAPRNTALALAGAMALVLASCATAEGTAPDGTPDAPQSIEQVRGERATVVRVIDGDTLDVSLNGQITRVRLLNVDTPETKHPKKMAECLGPEATAFLEDLLPQGTSVGLEYDQERKDKYDRTLAGVYLTDGRLVNAEIAREGLGVPVYILPNRRFLPPVQDAFAEAQQEKRGLLDPSAECTIPAQVQTVQENLTGSPADDAVTEAQALLDALKDPAMTSKPFITKIAGLPDVKTSIQGIRTRLSEIKEGKKKTPSAESHTSGDSTGSQQSSGGTGGNSGSSEDAGSRPAPVNPAPNERQAPAQSVPQPAPANPDPAPAPAPQPRADPPEPQPAPPAPAPAPPPPKPQPQPNQADQAPSGYYSQIPGYTGPRCYAPGGKFYKPC